MNFSLPQSRNRRASPSEGPRAKRAKPADDFLDLPTHLPNCAASASSDPAPKQAIVSVESGAAATVSDQPPAYAEGPAPVPSEQPKEPVFIEGTNITLQTEEDIAAWIAERKRNWPTRKNIERKAASKTEQHEQAQKAQSAKSVEAPKRSICKYFAKNNRCKFGARCKHSHDMAKTSNKTTINGIELTIPKRYKDPAEKGSLYTKLVQRDLYANENDFVLSFLQFLSSKHIIEMDGDYS